jgi:hypothetical protein
LQFWQGRCSRHDAPRLADVLKTKHLSANFPNQPLPGLAPRRAQPEAEAP